MFLTVIQRNTRNLSDNIRADGRRQADNHGAAGSHISRPQTGQRDAAKYRRNAHQDHWQCHRCLCIRQKRTARYPEQRTDKSNRNHQDRANDESNCCRTVALAGQTDLDNALNGVCITQHNDDPAQNPHPAHTSCQAQVRCVRVSFRQYVNRLPAAVVPENQRRRQDNADIDQYQIQYICQRNTSHTTDHCYQHEDQEREERTALNRENIRQKRCQNRAARLVLQGDDA